jgi:hypothetical protein
VNYPLMMAVWKFTRARRRQRLDPQYRTPLSALRLAELATIRQAS